MSFTAGKQCATLAEVRLQAERQFFENAMEIRSMEGGTNLFDRVIARGISEVFDKWAVPDLNGRVDPCGVASKALLLFCRQRQPIDEQRAACEPMPTEQKAHERGLPGSGSADDRDVLAGRDTERDILKNRVTRGDHAAVRDVYADGRGAHHARPSPLPPAQTAVARTWFECESITHALTGRPLEMGYLELVIPIFRV